MPGEGVVRATTDTGSESSLSSFFTSRSTPLSSKLSTTTAWFKHALGAADLAAG